MGNKISSINEKRNQKTKLDINKKLANRIQELSLEKERLEVENKELKKKINIREHLNEIDDEKIKKLVKKILDNKDINIGLLPDSIESKLYENIIRLLLSLIKETLDTTKIEFLGHGLQLQLTV